MKFPISVNCPTQVSLGAVWRRCLRHNPSLFPYLSCELIPSVTAIARMDEFRRRIMLTERLQSSEITSNVQIIFNNMKSFDTERDPLVNMDPLTSK